MPLSICVFCGSSPGTSPRLAEAAERMGVLLAQRDITMVNGAGGRGLMRIIADAVLGNGGRVIGVIPRTMVEREWAHTGLTEMHLVDTMHERKATMADLADGFAILPGGIGTLDEFFEIWTWWQLGLHPKPIGILNVDGFFDHLLTHIERLVEMEFISPSHRDRLIISTDPADLIERLASEMDERINPETGS